MNKHKKVKLDCTHILEFRQKYQYSNYDEPAEYCPKTYMCELKQFPFPNCKKCKDYQKRSSVDVLSRV